MANTDFVEELRWRGMLQDQMPGTQELLNSGMVKGYIGFDPTADSLGVGNLVQIMTLKHFQLAGHKPYVLLGGATGMVGDPSGKSAERNLLDEETLHRNLEGQRKQLGRFLNFESGPNKAEMVNNYDWFKNFSFLDFIREVGKHITVNYMMAKDSVKNRLESGMSFTEFSYQLVQGFDFFHLWNSEGVKLQMGGSDQWGNMVTGTELIRRKAGGEAFALTTPLIRKADGSKFGKTEAGNIWLDPKRTSPYQFYQFWLNASDEDAAAYVRIFTVRSRQEIENLELEHKQAPHLRVLQKQLASDITIMVHGEEEYKMAVEASEILFGKGTAETLKGLKEQDFFTVFEGVPQFELDSDVLKSGVSVVELLSNHAPFFSSKGECRKMMQQGGLSINKIKLEDANASLDSTWLLNGRYLLVQKGKKQYAIITEKK